VSRRSTAGYSHRVHQPAADYYVISWMWDRYYRDSRLRFPQTVRRITDLAGARRFAKKWGLPPVEPNKEKR